MIFTKWNRSHEEKHINIGKLRYNRNCRPFNVAPKTEWRYDVINTILVKIRVLDVIDLNNY